mgnify:CR=1 FL=1
MSNTENTTHFGNKTILKELKSEMVGEVFTNVAKKYDLNLIPFLLEGVALKPELNQDDGMHPNEKGTIIVSDTLTKSIISFIKK